MYRRALLGVLIVTGCGRVGFDARDEPASVTTSPLGGEWPDYASANDLSVACDVSSPDLRWSDCVHLGTYREVKIPGETSCEGLVARDELGALAWACAELDGGVLVRSTGLAPGRGLRDLIEGTAWRANRVTVTRDGALVAQTPWSTWWTTPIVPLPPSDGGDVVRLDLPRTVYALAETRVAAGYEITTDGVSLVTLGDAALVTDAAGHASCDLGGSNDGCVVRARSRQRLWVELAHESTEALFPTVVAWEDVAMSTIGAVRDDSPSLERAVWLGASRGNRVTDVTTRRATVAVGLVGSRGNLVEGVRQVNGLAGTVWLEAGSDHNEVRAIEANQDDGASIAIADSRENRLSRIHVAHAEACAIELSNAHDTWIADARTLDSNGPALCATGSTGTVLTRFHFAGNGVELSAGSSDTTITHGVISAAYQDLPFYITLSPRTTIAFVTVTNARRGGLEIEGSHDTVVHDVVLANIGGDAIGVDGSARYHLQDLAIGHTSGAQVVLVNASSGVFAGTLALGPGGGCAVSGGTEPGLDATCAPQGASTSSTRTGLDFAESIVGPLTSDDAANPIDQDGAALLELVVPSFPVERFPELFAFESLYRHWGHEGAFPTPTARTWCRQGAGTMPCRIWDFRLRASDAVLRGRAGTMGGELPRPVAGSPCPAYLAGDETVTDRHVPARTFLRHAIELPGGPGNDDGLCESGEVCVAAPSYGAYAGEGTLETGCIFTSGAVTDVTLHWWSQSGAQAR